MLYDFHQKQSIRTPGSVHATFLVCSLRSSASVNGNNEAASEDVQMLDSTVGADVSPNGDTGYQTLDQRVISLVKEERLDGKDPICKLWRAREH